MNLDIILLITLPTLEVSNVETSQYTSLYVDDTEVSNDDLWKLPLSNDTLSKLQQEDIFCNNILNQREKGNINRRTVVYSKRNC